MLNVNISSAKPCHTSIFVVKNVSIISMVNNKYIIYIREWHLFTWLIFYPLSLITISRNWCTQYHLDNNLMPYNSIKYSSWHRYNNKKILAGLQAMPWIILYINCNTMIQKYESTLQCSKNTNSMIIVLTI